MVRGGHFEGPSLAKPSSFSGATRKEHEDKEQKQQGPLKLKAERSMPGSMTDKCKSKDISSKGIITSSSGTRHRGWWPCLFATPKEGPYQIASPNEEEAPSDFHSRDGRHRQKGPKRAKFTPRIGHRDEIGRTVIEFEQIASPNEEEAPSDFHSRAHRRRQEDAKRVKSTPRIGHSDEIDRTIIEFEPASHLWENGLPSKEMLRRDRYSRASHSSKFPLDSLKRSRSGGLQPRNWIHEFPFSAVPFGYRKYSHFVPKLGVGFEGNGRVEYHTIGKYSGVAKWFHSP